MMSATSTGKSKLAIDLTLHFSGKVINSAKMQVFKGLDVQNNKVTSEEEQLVPDHLIRIVGLDAELTADAFCCAATIAIDNVTARGKLPVVASRSNSYIEALIDDPTGECRSKYKSCLLCLDVDMGILNSFVSDHIDKMVEGGLIEELCAVHRPNAVYTASIRRSIGMQELSETITVRKGEVSAINKMKARTCDLTCSQLEKIHRLRRKTRWGIHRLDTTVALWTVGEDKAAAWISNVARTTPTIVARFLTKGEQNEEGLHGEVATI